MSERIKNFHFSSFDFVHFAAEKFGVVFKIKFQTKTQKF
jgi:hypothetical protein